MSNFDDNNNRPKVPKMGYYFRPYHWGKLEAMREAARDRGFDSAEDLADLNRRLAFPPGEIPLASPALNLSFDRSTSNYWTATLVPRDGNPVLITPDCGGDNWREVTAEDWREITAEEEAELARAYGSAYQGRDKAAAISAPALRATCPRCNDQPVGYRFRASEYFLIRCRCLEGVGRTARIAADRWRSRIADLIGTEGAAKE